MKRRKVLKLFAASGLGLVLGHQGLSYLSYAQQSDQIMNNVSITLPHLGQELKIHGISTGGVKVKYSHKNKGLGIPQILLDPFWTDWMPIYVWVIEHPEGIILVDTGENAQEKNAAYFSCDPTTGWVNNKILRFNTLRADEIDQQLLKLGIQTGDIRWVVLTHLHLDHVDGLHHFPKSEIIISKKEYQHPYGAIPCLLPKWLSPNLIQYHQAFPHFEQAYPLTTAQDIWLVPTAGHTYGHQSVLLQSEKVDLLFAGDVAFNQQQLQKQVVAGICADKKSAKSTYNRIKAYAKSRPLVCLPAHDPNSGARLQNLQPISFP
ncbi:MAG: N-acyl homoserine lactonase family protein [Flammeovirgaceae bacterium]